MRLSDITDALFKWRKRSVSSVARLETTPAASLKTHPSTMPPNNAPKLPALPGSDLSYFPASSNSGRSLAPSKSVPVGRRRTQGRRRVVTSTTMRGLADLWDPYSPSPPPLRVKLPENSVVSRSNPSLSGNSQRNGMTSSSYSESSCSTYTHNVPPTPVLHNVLAEPMIASPNQSTPALSFTMPLINVHPPTSPPKDDKHVVRAALYPAVRGPNSPSSFQQRAQKQTSLPRHVTRPPAGKPPESQRYLPPKMVELEKSTETEQHDGNPFGQVLMDYMVNGSVEESVNSRETHDRSPPPPALTPSILSAYFRSPSEYDASRPASTTSSYPVTEHDEDFRTSSMMPRSPPSKSQMILRMEARRKNMNKRFGMDVESRMNTCHLESSVFLQVQEHATSRQGALKRSKSSEVQAVRSVLGSTDPHHDCIRKVGHPLVSRGKQDSCTPPKEMATEVLPENTFPNRQRSPSDERIRPDRSSINPRRNRGFLARDLESLMKDLEDFQEYLDDDEDVCSDTSGSNEARRASLKGIHPLQSSSETNIASPIGILETSGKGSKGKNTHPSFREAGSGRENMVVRKERRTAWERDQMKVPSRVWI